MTDFPPCSCENPQFPCDAGRVFGNALGVSFCCTVVFASLCGHMSYDGSKGHMLVSACFFPRAHQLSFILNGDYVVNLFAKVVASQPKHSRNQRKLDFQPLCWFEVDFRLDKLHCQRKSDVDRAMEAIPGVIKSAFGGGRG